MEEKNTEQTTNTPVTETKTDYTKSEGSAYSDKGGYGKGGGWKKWLIIYIVIAVVVYGLVYIYLKNRSDDSNGGTDNGSIY